MPSTRSTGLSENDNKPNTRSKGGGKSSSPRGGKAYTLTSIKAATKSTSVDKTDETTKSLISKKSDSSNKDSLKGKASISPEKNDVESQVLTEEKSILSNSIDTTQNTMIDSSDHLDQSQITITKNNISSNDSQESHHVNGNTSEENSTHLTNFSENPSSSENLLSKDGPSQQSVEEVSGSSTPLCASSNQMYSSNQCENLTNSINKDLSVSVSEVDFEVDNSNQTNLDGHINKKEERTNMHHDRPIATTKGNKSSKKSDLVQEIPDGITLRKSGRRSIPNRKYMDMEMDFSSKKSKSAIPTEKKPSKSPQTTKVSKAAHNSGASPMKRKLDSPSEKDKKIKLSSVESIDKSPVKKNCKASLFLPSHSSILSKEPELLQNTNTSIDDSVQTPVNSSESHSVKTPVNSTESDSLQTIVKSSENDSLQTIVKSTESDSLQTIVKSSENDSLQTPVKSTESHSVQTPVKSSVCHSVQTIVNTTESDSVQTPAISSLDSSSQISLDNTPVISVLKDDVPSAIVQNIVDSFSPSQMEKEVSDIIMASTNIHIQPALQQEIQPTIPIESEVPCVTTVTTNSLESFNATADNPVSLLSKGMTENISIFQNIQKDSKLKDQLQETLLSSQIEENIPEDIQHQKSLSKLLDKSDSKSDHVIVVHPEQQLDKSSEFLIAEKELIDKDLCETSVNNELHSVDQFNSIPADALQNSIPSSVVEPSYDVDVSLPSSKPIISFAEQLSHTTPYTVSLLNSSNKDKEAVESLMNETIISEKVLETQNVMMCLSTGSMCLDVAPPDDAQRLETEAAINEITASFPQTFDSSDIVVTAVKDTIPKSSLSLAEAAKMVAESQTIVDLQEEVTLPIGTLSHCTVQRISDASSPVTSNNSNVVPPTAVASTQTPLQLPRKGINSTKTSSVKSLPMNTSGHAKQNNKLDIEDRCNNDEEDEEDEEEDDEDGEDDDEEEEEEGIEEGALPNPKLTQEFIIVHLPEGTQIKRQRVDHRSKEESLVGVRVDVNGSYKCTECDYCTVKKVNWYKHRKKHLGLRPHSCIKCSYKATTSSNLKRHMAIHADLREYKCTQCSHFFRQKIHLERHMKYKHEEKKIRCPLCTYVCANENPDLKIHIKRRHVTSESTDGTMQAFTCGECGLVTMSKKDLKQHAKFHRKGPELKLFCEQCSFVTDCESRLRRHVLTHTKVKPFKCGLCEYRGSQKEHVLRHMKSRHSIDIQRNPRRQREDETSFDILERDKGDFTSRDKIFACNHCTMKFSKLINLYKHLHTQHKTIMPSGGQNEFYCVVCDFKTINKKNLLVHMRKHNMQEQNPPSHVYSCVLCRYMNPKRRNLFQHMMKKHGIEIVMNMKDDWSSNCFIDNNIPMVNEKGESDEPQVISVNNVPTTNNDSNQLMVVTDEGGNNPVQTVITIEDIASSMTKPVKMAQVSLPTENGDVPNKHLTDNLTQQQHAADAVEGLQALAEQPGIVETDSHSQSDNNEDDAILEDENIKTESAENEDVCDSPPIPPTDAPTLILNQLPEEGEVKNSVELSSEQIVHLSPGDYVEINGELYKVEISTEPAEETVTTTGDNEMEAVPVTAAAVSELIGAIPNFDTSVTLPPTSTSSNFEP
ncbi:claspin-like [Argonauta hians]